MRIPPNSLWDVQSHASGKTVTDDEFALYRELYSELRHTHPQRCELTRSEFDRAKAHTRTVCDTLSIGGTEVEIPQLVPIEVIEWLNEGYFASKYPEAHERGHLLHLSTWPGHEIGSRALDALADLGGKGAVIVVDGPADGSWSVRSSLALLARSVDAARPGDPELLGTQTYWSGPLSNPHVVPSAIPIPLAQGARSIGRDSIAGGGATGAFSRLDLSRSEAAAMYELYAAAYEVLGDHPCAQGVTPEEFLNMMLDDPRMSKLVFQREGIVQSICLITPDIASLDWVNLEFYSERFAGELESERLHWYPAIATDPTSAGARNAVSIVELIGDLYEEVRNPARILFDTPDINSEFLPAYLEELINALPHYEVGFEVIGRHEYHAVRLGA